MDTTNDHFVGMRGDHMVIVALPPLTPMPVDEALRLAAWLVAIVGDDAQFEAILAAVRSA